MPAVARDFCVRDKKIIVHNRFRSERLTVEPEELPYLVRFSLDRVISEKYLWLCSLKELIMKISC